MLNYFQMNSWVVTLLRGDPYALALLIHLMLHRNIAKDISHPQSHKQMAEMTDMTRPTVKVKLDKLKNLLLVEPVDAPKGKYAFKIMCINEPKITQIPSEPNTKTGTDEGWENPFAE